MKFSSRLLLVPTLMFALSACSVAPPGAMAPSGPSELALRAQQAVSVELARAAAPVTMDLGNKFGPSLAVTIKPPAADRALLAVQHRWVASDITSYRVELWSADHAGAKTGAVPLAGLNIAPGQFNAPPALAAFTGLPANSKYFVSVEAKGENTTTTATSGIRTLNVQTPASTVFNFLEDSDHNVEDSPAAQAVSVVLDSTVFNGSAAVNATVNDGTWTSTMPVGVTAVTSGLTFVDHATDRVGNNLFSPDGVIDAHFR